MYSQGAVNAFVSFAYAVINVSKQHESSEDGKRVYKYAKDLVAQVKCSCAKNRNRSNPSKCF